MLPIHFGRKLQGLLKDKAKVGAGVESDHHADLGQGQIGVRQQAAGFCDALSCDPVLYGIPCLFFKTPHKVRGTEMKLPGNFLNRNTIGKIFVYVVQNTLGY